MKWTYRCPKCRAHLNPTDSHLALLAKNSDKKVLMFFQSEPGDYGLVLPDDIELEKGQNWEFFCPVCSEDLTSVAEHNMAMIRLIDEEGSESSVFFSKIAGEHCTFIVNADGIKTFGPDENHYDKMILSKYF